MTISNSVNTAKLTLLSYDEVTRLGYKVTEFLIDRFKFFPVIHIANITRQNNSHIHTGLMHKLTLFEVNFYNMVCRTLIVAFRNNQSKVCFDLMEQADMKEITQLLTKSDLLIEPVANSKTPKWTLEVEFISQNEVFRVTEMSLGVLMGQRHIPLRDTARAS